MTDTYVVLLLRSLSLPPLLGRRAYCPVIAHRPVRASRRAVRLPSEGCPCAERMRERGSRWRCALLATVWGPWTSATSRRATKHTARSPASRAAVRYAATAVGTCQSWSTEARARVVRGDLGAPVLGRLPRGVCQLNVSLLGTRHPATAQRHEHCATSRSIHAGASAVVETQRPDACFSALRIPSCCLA
jgi:hypothetical protein